MIHKNSETVLSGGGLAPLTDPDPYPDSTPLKFLTRTVLSNTVSLLSLSTTVFNPTTGVFTDNFLTLINSYSFFSFKAIEVRIEFNYPPTSGGFLLLNFYPWNRPVADMFRTGLTGPGTTMEPVIVTAGMSQVVVRTLPWLYPKNKILTSRIGEIYTMWNIRAAVSLLLKNNSLAPTPSINMIIWTRLIEPKLYIPNTSTAVSLQSGLQGDATNGLLMGSVITVGTMAWNSFVGAAYKEVGSLASDLGKQAVGSGMNIVKQTIDQSSAKHRDLIAVKQGGPVRQDFRVNPWGDTSSCSQLTDRNPVVLDPSASFRAVSQYPGPGDFRVKDMIMRPTSILYYALTTNGQSLKIPQLCGPLHATAITGYSIYYERWVDYFSQFFRFWRGGFKWRFMFVLPPFQNCRVMIVVQTGTTSASPSVPDTILTREITVEGVVFEEFTVPFICEAPWRSCCAGFGLTGPNEETGQYSYSCPFITINLITPIFTEGDVAPALVVHGWSAAAEDFEFDGFSPQIPVTSSDEVLATMAPGVILQSQPLLDFERPFEGFYGRSLAEHVPGFDMTCRDIASRYAPRAITTNSYGSMSQGIGPGLFGQDITIGNQSCYDAIMALFLFFSGPMLVKMNISEFTSPNGFFSPYPSNIVTGATYDTPVWLGTAMFDKTVFPTVEFESPYVSAFDYCFVNNADLPSGYLTGIDNAMPFFKFTSGQNFITPLVAATPQSNFFIPMCPPLIDYWFSGLDELVVYYAPTSFEEKKIESRRKKR